MLDELTLRLARGPNFASLATLMPDGSPQVHVMWVDTDGDRILVNTEVHRRKFKNIAANSGCACWYLSPAGGVHRRKFKNIAANPLATVLILDRGDPWTYSEVRGEVVETVTGPEARAHIDALTRKYLGLDDYPNPITSERAILKIAPRRVFTSAGR